MLLGYQIYDSFLEPTSLSCALYRFHMDSWSGNLSSRKSVIRRYLALAIPPNLFLLAVLIHN